MSEITVKFINGCGNGFAEYVQVATGTTVGEFFAAKTNLGDPGSFNIRVNRVSETRDYVLQENDSLAITPQKIDGAH